MNKHKNLSCYEITKNNDQANRRINETANNIMCGRYVVKNSVTKTNKLVKSAIQVEDTENYNAHPYHCLLYTSPSPRDKRQSRMPSSA